MALIPAPALTEGSRFARVGLACVSRLIPSVARLRVGAHKEKDEPAGGSCSNDRHNTFPQSISGRLKPASPGGAARRSAMRRRAAKQQQERSYPDGEGGEQPNNVGRQKCYDAGHNLRLIDRSKARGRDACGELQKNFSGQELSLRSQQWAGKTHKGLRSELRLAA